MKSSLSIYAGPTARAQLLEQGVTAAQFKVMVGASGGPKWFVLYGLDRYLFGDFFAAANWAAFNVRLIGGRMANVLPRHSRPSRCDRTPR
ncbi:hypothetical protein OAT28_00415 [Gammaproteobacteria bacterium]|nr:hypothetical protein [Gammaproteobacteria bacterium]